MHILSEVQYFQKDDMSISLFTKETSKLDGEFSLKYFEMFEIINHEKILKERLENRENQIDKFCKGNNVSYSRIGNFVFIKYGISEWYFDISKENMKLYHKNNTYVRSEKFGNEYHVQKQLKPMQDVLLLLNYIVAHEKRKYLKIMG